jgi:phosphohistidine phosphatase
MNLYILRHASAGTRRPNPKQDEKRPLDKEGRQYILQLASVLNAFNLTFDLILSSPLKRCLQTASLIANESGYDARIQMARSLAPGGNYADFHKLLQDCHDVDNVLVVGHNPTLTQFLGTLILPAGSRTPATVRLRKGSMARVDMERTPARLHWLLDPRMVRALYVNSAKSSRRKTSRK